MGRGALAAALAAGGLASGSAHAETTERVDVSLGSRLTTDPYLEPGDEAATVAASLSVAPVVVMQGEVSTVVLNGQFRVDQYTERHGTDYAGSVGVAARTRVNERTTFSGGANLRTSRSSAQDFLEASAPDVPGPAEPISPEIPPPDVSGVGAGIRSTSYGARGSFDYVLSPTQTLGLGVSVSRTDVAARTVGDSAQYGVQANYGQQLNEQTSLQASLQAGAADYADESRTDATFITPLIGVRHLFSQTTNLTAQVGATLTRLEGGQEHIDLALNANLCRRQDLSSLCATASRSSQATALAGVRTVSALGLAYSLQLGRLDRLSLNARYARTDQIAEGLTADGRDREIFALAGNYSRNIGQRLFAYVSPGFAYHNSSSNSRSATNLQIEIGIRYRFGDIQ
jgi:hypothetical protein